MKKTFVRTISGIVDAARKSQGLLLAGLLLTAIFWLVGCEQPGETTAKGNRRHLRNLSINQQSFNNDLDRALLFDKPSTLTEKRIPPDISE
jgi:hypothetical protein